MKFNINDHIYVRLTDKGRAVYAEHYRVYRTDGGVPPIKYFSGYAQFQAWEAMRVFGRHLRLGGDNCFETTIFVGKPPTAEEAEKAKL